MLINPDKKYIPSLTRLWANVFGDEEAYIGLFFKKAYFDSECFAEIRDGEIISALYLLKSHIRIGGKIYHGRYLYAAATDKDFRGRGIMTKLLHEAESYVRSIELDFIALVPAEDSLYDYYGRFGYKQLMYKYKIKSICPQSENVNSYKAVTKEDFYKYRSDNSCDMLFYNRTISAYAYDCLDYFDKRVAFLSDKSYYIDSQEIFCGDGDEKICTELLKSISTDIFFSNCDLSLGERVRNGMVLPINAQLENKEIYMNIALD